MITRLSITVFLVALMLAVSVSAQEIDKANLQESTTSTGLGITPSFSPWSLLDASRITWSHSYSVSYFSGNSYSGSAGVLNSSMLYEFSSKLSLALNLGVLHNTGALWGEGEHDATLLPGFRLDYRPSEKFFMSVSFQTVAGYGTPYWGSSRWGGIDPRR